MPSVWITGAYGFIGRHLARYLAGQGSRVSGIGHGAWPEKEAMEWGVSYWLNADISNNNLGYLQSSAGFPDVVYHLAGGSSVGEAIRNPYEDFKRTVASTAELLEWLRQHSPNSKLVSISSAAVYGANHSGPISEEAGTEPFSPYGSHKFMMEELCRSYAQNYGMNVVLPRLFSVYGSGLKKQLLWDFCNKLAAGSNIELGGTGKELRDWIDIRDVIIGLERVNMLASSSAPVINLASGTAASVGEITTMVLDFWSEVTSHRPEVTFSGVSRPGDPFSLVADVNKMRETGIENNISLPQGISDYVTWFLKQAR